MQETIASRMDAINDKPIAVKITFSALMQLPYMLHTMPSTRFHLSLL